MRPNGVVVTSPALDDDLGFTQRIEDLTVEQFIPQATSLTESRHGIEAEVSA